eukprot:209178-Pelagomonas_calceolata.AAC.3
MQTKNVNYRFMVRRRLFPSSRDAVQGSPGTIKLRTASGMRFASHEGEDFPLPMKAFMIELCT